MNTERSIQEWRAKIDELDLQLVRLLNERSRCAIEVGKIKRTAQLPLYQPDREKEILARVTKGNSGPLSDTAIQRLFERILDEARAIERGAMGPEDSGSQQAKK